MKAADEYSEPPSPVRPSTHKLHGILLVLYFVFGLYGFATFVFHFEMAAWYRSCGCVALLLVLGTGLLQIAAALGLVYHLIRFIVRGERFFRLVATAFACVLLSAPQVIRVRYPLLMFRMHFDRHEEEYSRIVRDEEERPGVTRDESETYIELPDTRLLITGSNYSLVYSPGGRAEARHETTGHYFARKWKFEAPLGDFWYVVGY